MRQVVLILNLLLFTFNFGQNNLIHVKYSLTYKPSNDVLYKDEIKEDFFHLYIDVSKHESTFISQSKKTSDSLFQNVKNVLDLYKYKDIKGSFNNVIIYDFKSITLKEYDNIGSLSVFYSLKNFNINWEIKNDKKLIGGHEVMKATCNLFGREWVAWFFTKLVSIPEGPYKFKGLPGLVAEISDIKEDYKFSFVSMNKSTYQEFSIAQIDAKEITFQKFNDLKKQISDNIEQAIPDYNKFDDELKERMKGTFLTLKKLNNNPLELKPYNQ